MQDPEIHVYRIHQLPQKLRSSQFRLRILRSCQHASHLYGSLRRGTIGGDAAELAGRRETARRRRRFARGGRHRRIRRCRCRWVWRDSSPSESRVMGLRCIGSQNPTGIVLVPEGVIGRIDDAVECTMARSGAVIADGRVFPNRQQIANVVHS